MCLWQICVICKEYFFTLSESLQRHIYAFLSTGNCDEFQKLEQIISWITNSNERKYIYTHTHINTISNENEAATHNDRLTLRTYELVLRTLLRPLHHHNESTNNFH